MADSHDNIKFIADTINNAPDDPSKMSDEDRFELNTVLKILKSTKNPDIVEGLISRGFVRNNPKIAAALIQPVNGLRFYLNSDLLKKFSYELATGNHEMQSHLKDLKDRGSLNQSEFNDVIKSYLDSNSNFDITPFISVFFGNYPSFKDKATGRAVAQKMATRQSEYFPNYDLSLIMPLKNHGLSLSDFLKLNGDPNLRIDPQTGELSQAAVSYLKQTSPDFWHHMEALSDQEKKGLQPHLEDLYEVDRKTGERTVLTPLIESEFGSKYPHSLFQNKKYEVDSKFLKEIAEDNAQLLTNRSSKSDDSMKFLFDARFPSDVIDSALKTIRSKNKPHEFSEYGGGIQMGPQVFARRSLTPGGYTGHPDVGIHPDREIKVKVGSAVLRKLRDHLEKAGQIRPEDLPKGELWNSITRPITDKSGNVNHVQDWNPLRAANGKLDPSKVQQYIDSMPEMKFIWSHDYWQSPLQRHSNQPSAITMINLHPDTVQTLRDKGLYQDFLDIQRSLPDIHPLGRDTIGWIRHTGSDAHIYNPNEQPNVFVDEVQSDLYNKLRSSSEPKHKQLMDIIFQGFHPSEILHESLQEQMRQQGSIGAPWATHTVASKSPMALDEAKEAPVHFKVSYEQVPKRMGAKPSTYGTLPTQTGDNPDHATKYALQGKPTWEDQIRKTEEPYPHTPSIVEHDYMNGQVKNLYAYKQHIKTNPQGAHVYLDGSHAKTLLTNHSHEKYFDTKNDMIGVLKRIVDEACDFPCPIYHVGGMKFYINTHGLKDALKIARAVDKVKDVMPGSEHYKPHFDIGVSENREEAHDAMERANAIKDHQTHPTQTYVVLGQDGHLQKLNVSSQSSSL